MVDMNKGISTSNSSLLFESEINLWLHYFWWKSNWNVSNLMCFHRTETKSCAEIICVEDSVISKWFPNTSVFDVVSVCVEGFITLTNGNLFSPWRWLLVEEKLRAHLTTNIPQGWMLFWVLFSTVSYDTVTEEGQSRMRGIIRHKRMKAAAAKNKPYNENTTVSNHNVKLRER